ncbi:winged helix-turn-helix domain-containing protein [Bacillus piscicola]|uniref:winged helix-turn-helix domain-containing protein n=1 Tax=Bacillus piscicola TaxID=1632684 RepID=UPI001F09F6B6|nr:winged helix-turn-helix domain-containing protein [Bacillus piscicola]
MLEHLITSKTRIRMLIKFFTHEGTEAYLRELAAEFGDSTNAVRVELNRFMNAGLLCRTNVKNRKVYRANTTHPFFADIQYMVRRYIGWYMFQQLYVQEDPGMKAIYLCEKKDKPDDYAYIIVQDSDSKALSHEKDDSFCVKTLTSTEVEKLQKENRPCFRIWTKQNDTVIC